MAFDEALDTMRKAIGEVVSEFELKFGREPSAEEVRSLVDECIAKLNLGETTGAKSGHAESGAFNQGGENSEAGRRPVPKPALRHVGSIEEARKIAAEIVESSKPYRISSCEMRVLKDGESVSLHEEQILSDGTKIMGRLFTYDTHEEAIDAVSKILWESALERNGGSIYLVSVKG